MHCTVPVPHRDDASLRKGIQKQFSALLMSDSKWGKLLGTLVANAAEVKLCLVKLMWDEAEPHRQLCFDEDTEYNFNYYAPTMEAMASGKPRGWYDYKEIEWLDFPRVAGATKRGEAITQDLRVIKEALEAVGQFALESTPDNLRLYAYFR